MARPVPISNTSTRCILRQAYIRQLQSIRLYLLLHLIHLSPHTANELSTEPHTLSYIKLTPLRTAEGNKSPSRIRGRLTHPSLHQVFALITATTCLVRGSPLHLHGLPTSQLIHIFHC